MHDIHVYPGPGSPEPEAKRAAVLGEFGGLGLPVEGHTWDEEDLGLSRHPATEDDLTRKYEKLLAGVCELKDKPGLSAAVYTQTTDVETEANGLMTYDRAVVKVDLERIAAAQPGRLLAGAGGDDGRAHLAGEGADVALHDWKKPADGWCRARTSTTRTGRKGAGGFGTKGTPGAVVRTEWNTPDIWLRREFTLPRGNAAANCCC